VRHHDGLLVSWRHILILGIALILAVWFGSSFVAA
jgi:hypothetical protein